MRSILILFFPLALAASTQTFEDYPPNYKVTVGEQWTKELKDSSLYMIRDEQFNYACNISVPSASKYLQAVSSNLTLWDLQKKEAIQSVKSFHDQHKDVCIYREFGYWSYTACFGKDITQFHFNGDLRKIGELLHTDKTIPEHRLGYMRENAFSKVSDFEFVKKSDGSRYLSQLVYNGTTCDLTGKERTVYIQYKCDPDLKGTIIEDVEELRTCQYRMVISSADLCRYPVMMSENYVSEANISCLPVKEEDSFTEETLLDHAKLDLSTLSLQPISDAFFLGSSKPNVLPLYPDVLVSNKEYHNLGKANETEPESTILTDIGHAFMNMVKSNKVYTPKGVSPRRPVKKGDRFEYVTEVYGLNREFIANVVIEQSENDFLVTYFADYGSADGNFVSFIPQGTKAPE